MACIVCLISTAWGQQEEKLITLENRGANAKSLFEKLSTQAGRSLSIAQSLADEPLVLRLEKAKLSVVMQKLAFAFDAEWVQEPSTIRLIPIKRPPVDKSLTAVKQIQAQQKKALERLKTNSTFTTTDAAALVEQLSEHFRKQAAKTPSTDYDYDSEGAKIARKGPFTALACRVFTLLDAKELALATRNRRVVWSTRPTAMQRALPNTVWNAIGQFQKEYGLWRDAVGNRQFQVDMNRGIATDIYQLINKNLEWSANESDDQNAAASKLLVMANSWGQELSQLEIKLVDAKGKYIATCNMDMYSLNEGQERNFEPPKKDPNALKISLDALGSEFWKRFRYDGGDDGTGSIPKEPISQELENYLLNPEKNEPLALMAGQALIKYSNAKNLQLVAALNDVSLLQYGADEKGEIDAQQMLTAYRAKGWGYRTEESDGWFVTGWSKQSDESQIMRMRPNIDRKALGKLCREAKKAGYLTFENAADFLAATSNDLEEEVNWMAGYYLSIFVSDASLINNEDSRKLMLIYGSMDPMQRRSILDAKPIPYRTLLPNQQQIIQTCVFGRDVWRIRFEPRARSNPPDSSEWEGYYNGIGSEPTERYANGINPQSPLVFSLKSGSMIRASTSVNGQRGYTEMDPEQLGMQMFYSSLPENESRGLDGPFDHFSAMSRRTLSLKLTLDDSTYLMMEAHEVLSKSPSVDSIDKLPADIAAKIRLGQKKAEDSYAKQSQRPPPPPFALWW